MADAGTLAPTAARVDLAVVAGLIPTGARVLDVLSLIHI